VEIEYSRGGKVLQRCRGSGGNVRLSTNEFLVFSGVTRFDPFSIKRCLYSYKVKRTKCNERIILIS